MGSVVGEITGANRSARRAASSAARAQQNAAGEAFREFRGQFRTAMDEASSPEELATLEKSLSAQQQNVNRQQQLFNALDPAIMAASQQALDILQGKESQFTAPFKAQRERQRAQLVDTLRESGIDPASSAGQQQLQRFDLDTSEGLQQQQTGALQGLFGMGQSGAAGRNALGANVGQLANIGSAFGNIARNRADLRLRGAVGLNQARQGVIQNAAAPHVGAMMRAQQIQGIGTDLVRAGAAYASGGMSEAGAGASGMFSSMFSGGGASGASSGATGGGGIGSAMFAG